jgi:hypothetical protein
MTFILPATLLFLVSVFVSAITTWAGAPTQGHHNRRVLLPHICTTGPNAGQTTQVHLNGTTVVCDNCPNDPNACVIDYQAGQNTTFEAKLTIGVDDQPVPPSPQQTSMTILLEVEKDGQVHFFADSFFGEINSSYSPGYPVFEKDPDLTDGITSLFDSAMDATILQNRFLYVAPASSNVIAEGLRTLFGVTDDTVIPVITDVIESYGFTRTVHTGAADLLGSSLHFKVVIRFVNP